MRHKRRILFTNFYEEFFIKRSIILTGITPVINRPDLLDRAMVVELDKLKGSYKNFFTEWNREAPIFRRGIFDLLSQVLKTQMLADDSLNNIHQRDQVPAIVTKALYAKDSSLKETATFVKDLKLRNAGLLDTWVSQFSAFLNDPNNDLSEEKYLAVSSILHKYLSWTRENFGKEVSFNFSGLELGTIIVSTNAVPETPIKFGRFLARSSELIEAVSGFTITEPKRRPSGMYRKIYRKISLTELL
jgi:hypothetical protein